MHRTCPNPIMKKTSDVVQGVVFNKLLLLWFHSNLRTPLILPLVKVPLGDPSDETRHPLPPAAPSIGCTRAPADPAPSLLFPN